MTVFKITLAARRFSFTFIERITNLIRSILAFAVFPQKCLLCGFPSLNQPLCIDCLKKTLFFHIPNGEERPQRCERCGKELLSEKDLCTSCRNSPFLNNLASVFPLYPYRFWAKDLLFLWKIQNIRNLSPLFAAVLFKAWKEQFWGIPLVPVPPRPGKIRKKGWDQISELADFLELRYRVPVLRVLRRTEKKEQKRLNRDERLENKRRFVLKRECGRLFYGNPPEQVVVLDDILTTGATLEKCAQELISAGIKKVHALTLFIVE